MPINKNKLDDIDKIIYDIHKLLDAEKEREINAIMAENVGGGAAGKTEHDPSAQGIPAQDNVEKGLEGGSDYKETLKRLRRKLNVPEPEEAPSSQGESEALVSEDVLIDELLKEKQGRAPSRRNAPVVDSIKALADEQVREEQPQVIQVSQDKNVSTNFLGVGLDVGTSNLVASRITQSGQDIVVNRNAFLNVREDASTIDILSRLNIPRQVVGGKSCVIGKDAFEFSNFFDRITQRSMNIGVINPFEREAIHILNLLVQKMLWQPQIPNEICCFSLPASPVDNAIDINYHKNVVETMLSCFGYEPMALNEGYAVVLSELKDRKFTGVGISCGGGMVNVCITYMAVVIAEFSIARGGDWIDLFASKALDMSSTKVSLVKERGMSILKPEDREQESIAIYYKQYIRYFLEQMARILKESDKNVQFEEPVDIVFAGGSSMVGGFIEAVRRELKTIDLGIPINEVRLAEDPFTSVSRGCLFNAQMASKNGK
ncbi:MAG: hypothetical protein HQL21_05690 [Candidatus Omnitrophica bacterium]|nr:hypothetical protein [Candidatus Omnitrophota bacterium]